MLIYLHTYTYSQTAHKHTWMYRYKLDSHAVLSIVGGVDVAFVILGAKKSCIHTAYHHKACSRVYHSLRVCAGEYKGLPWGREQSGGGSPSNVWTSFWCSFISILSPLLSWGHTHTQHEHTHVHAQAPVLKRSNCILAYRQVTVLVCYSALSVSFVPAPAPSCKPPAPRTTTIQTLWCASLITMTLTCCHRN